VTLLFQIAGALAAGAALVALIRGLVPSGRSGLAIVAVIPVVVASIVAFGNLKTATRGFYDQRKVNRLVPANEAAVRGGVVGGVDVAFLDWVRRRIGPEDSFHLIVGNEAAHPTAFQWATYQLAPRLAVSDPDDADWIVLYDQGLSAGYPSASFGVPSLYAPRYALGSRRVAR
jgi:hypothetical protein